MHLTLGIINTAADKIDQANAFVEQPGQGEPMAHVQPEEQQEIELPAAFHWTEEALSQAKSKELEEACNQIAITREAIQVLPGKNTNKKLRSIILSYVSGELLTVVNKYRRGEGPVDTPPPTAPEEPAQEPAPEETPPIDPDDGMEPMEGGDEGEGIAPNAEFDNTAQPEEPESPAEAPKEPESDGSIPEDTNKFGIEVPELSENDDRPFEVLSTLYFAFQEKGIMNEQFDPANAKLLKGKYKNMEEFCKLAPVNEINLLLNSLG